MGAVIPIVGAVVGTASAVSSISKQNKQAKEQKRAIQAQEEASAANTAMRLEEIERQKLYSKSQIQIDNLARLNAREVERAETRLQQQELALQEQYLNAERQAVEQMTGQDLQNQLGSLDVQGFANQQQGMLASESAQNQFAANQARDSSNTRLSLQGSILNQNQGMLDIERARGNSIIGANQQQIAAQEQATQLLQGVAQQTRQFDRQTDQRLRQQASMAIQLAAQTGSANSLSDQALLMANVNDISQDTQDIRMDSNQQIGNVEQSLAMQGAMRDFQINRANQDAATQGSVNIAQGTLQREGLFDGFSINQFANNAQLQNTLANINLGQQTSSQMQGIQRQDLHNKTYQERLLAELNRTMGQGQIAQERAGMETLQQAQENKYQLENEMANVNERFSELALNSSKVSAEVAGKSELASLQAQRRGVQSPGFLGTAGALASGAAGIYNGFLSGR